MKRASVCSSMFGPKAEAHGTARSRHMRRWATHTSQPRAPRVRGTSPSIAPALLVTARLAVEARPREDARAEEKWRVEGT